MKKKILFAIISFFLFSGLALSQEKKPYKIIVNKSNPISSMTKIQLSKLFLKKATTWENGKKVMPVDLVDISQLRNKFSQELLGKKTAAVKAYWQRQIFSGRGVPPPEKKTNGDVLSYVHDNPGAVGYISVSTKLSAHNVKIVEIK